MIVLASAYRGRVIFGKMLNLIGMKKNIKKKKEFIWQEVLAGLRKERQKDLFSLTDGASLLKESEI
ncbi:MAG: hypothetical protein KKD94_02460 [Nanoarchaeota archaeon]|nr:hypothetical protein [Nanoarchaeota archaeon]MBU1988320.1 hypothetical protein [Nanoarchaeota archaeon]